MSRATQNRVGFQIQAYLLDHGMTPEQWGEVIGVSDMTIRRAMDGERLFDSTKWAIARGLGEEPSTLWPPMPRRRQPGGSRQQVAA